MKFKREPKPLPYYHNAIDMLLGAIAHGVRQTIRLDSLLSHSQVCSECRSKLNDIMQHIAEMEKAQLEAEDRMLEP